MERVDSNRFSFMDPSTCGEAALRLDPAGGLRYVTGYASTVEDDEYVFVPYNFG